VKIYCHQLGWKVYTVHKANNFVLSLSCRVPFNRDNKCFSQLPHACVDRWSNSIPTVVWSTLSTFVRMKSISSSSCWIRPISIRATWVSTRPGTFWLATVVDAASFYWTTNWDQLGSWLIDSIRTCTGFVTTNEISSCLSGVLVRGVFAFIGSCECVTLYTQRNAASIQLRPIWDGPSQILRMFQFHSDSTWSMLNLRVLNSIGVNSIW
jgi:hypothetical protein